MLHITTKEQQNIHKKQITLKIHFIDINIKVTNQML